MNKQSSQILDAVRTPLVFLVILIHILPEVRAHVELSARPSSIYIFFSEFVAHNLAHIAVPCFFLISGFLFFQNISIDKFEWGAFTTKWKKRLSTLLIPYLLWNIIRIALIVGKNSLCIRLGMAPDYGLQMIRDMGVWGCLWTGPINGPLWFIRDLMCMALIAPAFFFLFKKTGYIGVILLFLVDYLGLDTHISGFGVGSMAYFGMGAFFGLYQIDFVDFCHRKGQRCLLPALALFIASTCFNDYVFNPQILKLAVPFGIVCLFYFVGHSNDYVQTSLSKMAAPALFTYFLHKIYILDNTKGLFVKLFGTSTPALFVDFLIRPWVIVAICFLCYYLLNRICPSVLNILLGNRRTHKI